jgi:hypothetical protein
MRLTPFWTRAALAIAAPVLILFLGSRAIDWQEAELGGLVYAFFLLFVALVSFLGFAAWAVISARPGTQVGRVLRRGALGFVALVSLGYGANALLLARDNGRLLLIAFPILVLLPVGLWALHALWSDLTGKSLDRA